MNSSSEISSISWIENSSKISSTANHPTSSATDSQIKEKVPRQGKKIILITTIVICILIIITILATIISLFAFNKKQTSSSTYQVNSNDHTESTLRATTTWYDINGGGASERPPCTSYTVVNDPLRNVNAIGLGGECDNGGIFNTSIGGRWIRFIGAGGTMMPTLTPRKQHCGAYVTGWLNGTLPSISGSIVNITACFDSGIEACNFKVFISVANCADFYVYFLRPVSFCNARYCTV